MSFRGADTKGRLEGCLISALKGAGVQLWRGADPVLAECRYLLECVPGLLRQDCGVTGGP